jgi:hypothetical protein
MRSVDFVLAMLFGLFLYWCRCRRRVWYGIGQIISALTLICLALFLVGQIFCGLVKPARTGVNICHMSLL